MTHPILNQLDPPEQLKNISFLKETCHQINKDLNGFTDREILLTESLLNDPFNELIYQLTSIIEDLKISSSLQSFVYKVDLEEKKYLAFVLGKSSLTRFISDLIIRSSQKVFLRWYFSNRMK